jgi:glycosyltransferase involved in cell wall biosynthesis
MSSSKSAASPRVSAVMCTRNRPDKIRQAVTSVLANDHPDFDLTIIDQSTTDETREALADLIETDSRLAYVHTVEAGLSRAYNTGVGRTTGDVIAFTDDDCIAPTDWLTTIVAAFDADDEADLLYGQVVPARLDDDSAVLTPLLVIDHPERLGRGHGFRVFGMGANFAARRRLFDRIGGFDEILGGGGPLKSSQDYDLAYRTYKAGSVIALRPEVAIRHDGRREHADWPALLKNYGVGDGAFYAKHVRCRDPYALWLLARRVVVGYAKYAVKWALRRKPEEGPYLAGILVGVRDSFGFGVDRRTKLYVER